MQRRSTASTASRALVVLLAPVLITSQLQAAAPARQLPLMSAAVYNAIIGQVVNCDDFKAREPSLPRANPFLAKLVRKEWPKKGEFETTAAHNQRIKAEIARAAIDPNLVLLELNLSSTYDADTQVLTVITPLKYNYRGQGFLIASTSQSKKIDHGAHLYGPMAIATSTATYEVRVNLKGFEDDGKITLTPDQARLFKLHGRMVLLGSFQAPYLKEDFDSWYSKRLFGGDSKTYSTIFNFVTRCGTITYTDKSQFPKAIPSAPSRAAQPPPSAPVPRLDAPKPIQPANPPVPRNYPPGSPIPILSPTAWVSTEDWPSAALREGREGVAAYTLDVGTDGLPIACAITTSSGHTDLDETTCTLLMRRARFEPGKDGKGNPMRAVYTGRMRWMAQ